MLSKDLYVKLGAEVKQSFEINPAEALVADAGAGQGNAAAGKVGSRRLSEHGVSAHALDSQLAHTEGVAARNKSGVGILAVRQIHIAIDGVDNGNGKASPVVVGMSHPLDAELVVPELCEDVSVPDRDKVEELVATSASRQGQSPLLGNEAVKFELSNFHVQPGTIEQIVEADVGGFEVKGAGIVGGGNQEERNILLEGTAGENVQSAQVEAGSRDLLFHGAIERGVVNRYLVGAFAAPEGSDA